jgi:hypothetical protein
MALSTELVAGRGQNTWEFHIRPLAGDLGFLGSRRVTLASGIAIPLHSTTATWLAICRGRCRSAAKRVGFVNSVVADLQGNRAGSREAYQRNWVAAATLATAASLSPNRLERQTGPPKRLRPRRAKPLLGPAPPNATGRRRAPAVIEASAPRNRLRMLTRPLESLSAVRRPAEVRPKCRPPVQDFPLQIRYD